MTYFKDFDFTGISFIYLPRIGVIMLILAFVVALSMPAWQKWKSFLIVPLPLSLGIYLNLLVLEPLNALIACSIIFLILVLHVEKSIHLQSLLIKNIPHISLRPAIKGYLFAISIAATFIVLLNPMRQEIDIGEMVSQAISAPLGGFIGKEMDLPNQYQEEVEQQIELEVTTTIKKAVEPYRHLINIIMSSAVFVGMQGLNAIIYLIFSLLITPVFWIVKKLHFILSDLEDVKRENLHF